MSCERRKKIRVAPQTKKKNAANFCSYFETQAFRGKYGKSFTFSHKRKVI